MDETESLSVRVVRAVAEKEGVRPVDLEIPLHDAINPEALDSLFRTSGATATFDYYGYTITVSRDGILSIEE